MTNDLSIEALQYYEDHPVEYCHDLIGVDVDAWQAEAFQALYKDHFLAIKSGSGVGKTIFLSLATMHFLGTKPFSKVPTTAPSQHQLNDLLWGYHYKHINQSTYLNELLHWTQTKVAVKGYEPEWYAVARTARVSPNGKVAEGLQGFHAEENLLYIVDEASGVDDNIFPAVEGALTGKHAYAILAANPTRLVGYFYKIFNDPSLKGLYHPMTISAENSKFVEKRYIKMMESLYGRDHPVFQIKVLGEFPSSDIELLFPVADVERMQFNEIVDMRGDRETPIEIGIDIGRKTNKSVACIRRGLKVIEFQEKHLAGVVTDTVTLINWGLDLIHTFNASKVKIDANGIGAGVYDGLVRVYPKVVFPVIAQASPAENKKTRYVNLRAQGYWELRELVPNLCCKRWPDQLLKEMSFIRYILSNGKIQIQSKEEMSLSPDYTDAMVNAFLDSGICVDKFNIITVPVMMSNVNDELIRHNPLITRNKDLFGFNAGEDRSTVSSKWDVLHG